MARSGTKTKKKREGLFRLKQRKKRLGHDEPGALDYVEEAIHILRRIPITIFLPYCVGTLPFIIAFFLFWNDMAQSGLAERMLPASSLGLALLFVWMKCWQSIFTYHLHCFVSSRETQRLTFKQWGKLIQRQSLWQATGFITLGPALLITIPFGRAYAFYQNLTVLDIRETENSEKFIERAYKQAMLWSGQGTMLVLIFFFLGLFALFSWQIVIVTIPFLARTLLGYQSILANSGDAVFSSTTTPLALAFTYLSIDPIVKTVYTLRCYYGESRKNGEDLLTALKDFRATMHTGVRATSVIAILLTCLLTPCNIFAQDEATPVANEQKIDIEELDQSIDKTLSQREYSWRFPREDEAELDLNEITWLNKIRDFVEGVFKWISEKLKSEDDKQEIEPREPSALNFQSLVEFIAYIALFVLAIVIIVFAIKLVRNWQAGPPSDQAIPLDEALPDLNSEDVTADSLSLSRWVLYAKELLEKGSYRLAMRAYFFAQLAHFSDQGFINIHKFKSNRDYYRELSKRSHTPENLLEIYNHEVVLFEGVWYGEHAVGINEIKNMENYLTQLGVAL